MIFARLLLPYYLNCKIGYDQNDTKIAPFDVLQIEKLRTQANDQEANLLAQEEEVHGKQRELDALKEEEKQLMDDIKASEKEIEKFEHDLEVALELNSEVSLFFLLLNFDECSVKTFSERIRLLQISFLSD